MTNVCSRWMVNKTDDLHAAFFNGVGYESWENIWGAANSLSNMRNNYDKQYFGLLIRGIFDLALVTAAARGAFGRRCGFVTWTSV